MKYILIFGIFLSSSFATAQLSTCLVDTKQPVLILESVVTIEGKLKLNPMVAPNNGWGAITELENSLTFIVQPRQSLLLEQWAEAGRLACKIPNVTLELNVSQQEKLSNLLQEQVERALVGANFTDSVKVTGTVRWSESSLEGAGNAVLTNVTEISLK